ncbi:MAG: hypothetical protein HC796_00970 [Synechococcaceae cyanobacterium RL_1_2]|nr:hypothetical protein [Synechococcaceae cyanobacterium RL_1_2]
MFDKKKLTKEQLLKAIEELEKNPHNKSSILTDISIGAVGAAGAGAAVAAFGGTSVLFGLVTVAPPIGLVVGGAALGAAALVGVKKIIFDGTYDEGKKAEMLRQLKDLHREMERNERVSTIDEKDNIKLYSLLKEPIRLNLLTPAKAQELMSAVENGHITITEAIKLIEDIIQSAGRVRSRSWHW